MYAVVGQWWFSLRVLNSKYFFILKIYTDLFKKIIRIFMTFVVYLRNANNILQITKQYIQMYDYSPPPLH